MKHDKVVHGFKHQQSGVKLEPCVVCLRVQVHRDCLCKVAYIRIKLLEEDGNACQMPRLLVFVCMVDGLY